MSQAAISKYSGGSRGNISYNEDPHRQRAAPLGAAGIDDDIEEAIYTAIEEYQSHRLRFNESRAVTFSTVADQDIYDGATRRTSGPSSSATTSR